MNLELLLASQSPRRRQLIQLVGLPFAVTSADVDESSITEADPARNVVKTAEFKAETIAAKLQSPAPTIIVAADTTVALDNKMLGKPGDAATARHMLLALRGRTHEVHTGLVLLDRQHGRKVEGVNTAVVTMRSYSEAEIDDYIATGDPLDKAGAYAIQHPLFRPVSHFDGCYLSVVGLSVCHLLQLLAQLDIVPVPDLAALHAAHQATACPLLATFG